MTPPMNEQADRSEQRCAWSGQELLYGALSTVTCGRPREYSAHWPANDPRLPPGPPQPPGLGHHAYVPPADPQADQDADADELTDHQKALILLAADENVQEPTCRIDGHVWVELIGGRTCRRCGAQIAERAHPFGESIPREQVCPKGHRYAVTGPDDKCWCRWKERVEADAPADVPSSPQHDIEEFTDGSARCETCARAWRTVAEACEDRNACETSSPSVDLREIARNVRDRIRPLLDLVGPRDGELALNLIADELSRLTSAPVHASVDQPIYLPEVSYRDHGGEQCGAEFIRENIEYAPAHVYDSYSGGPPSCEMLKGHAGAHIDASMAGRIAWMTPVEVEAADAKRSVDQPVEHSDARQRANQEENVATTPSVIEWLDAAIATVDDVEVERVWRVFKERLSESNSLLRSALSIAERGGLQTNWEAFAGQVRKELNRQHELKIYPQIGADESSEESHADKG